MKTCFIHPTTTTMSSSFTISLNGNQSHLSTDFNPSLELDDESAQYECALVYFKTFNSIPNVDKSNNLFHYGNNVIEIPEGAYELNDIIHYLDVKMVELLAKTERAGEVSDLIDMEANTNTAKCMIFSPVSDVHFDKPRSIGSLLGFSPKVLRAGKVHWSDQSIDILITNTIRVECSIVEGSFINNQPCHVIHEFSPTVPPGYQIIECPSNVIYLPLKKTNNIQNIEVRIVNEHGSLVNFRGENISLRLHIRQMK